MQAGDDRLSRLLHAINSAALERRLRQAPAILREMVPAATIAANSEIMLKDVEAATRAMGLQIQVLKANTSDEIDAAFATFVRARPDALLVGSFLLSRPCPISSPGGTPRGSRLIWRA